MKALSISALTTAPDCSMTGSRCMVSRSRPDRVPGRPPLRASMYSPVICDSARATGSAFESQSRAACRTRRSTVRNSRPARACSSGEDVRQALRRPPWRGTSLPLACGPSALVVPWSSTAWGSHPGRVSTLLNHMYSVPSRFVHACLQVTEQVWQPMHLSRFMTIAICAMTFIRTSPPGSGGGSRRLRHADCRWGRCN